MENTEFNSLAELWEDWMHIFVDDSIELVDFERVRWSFYAGAASTLTLMTKFLKTSDSEGEFIASMKRLFDEAANYPK